MSTMVATIDSQTRLEGGVNEWTRKKTYLLWKVELCYQKVNSALLNNPSQDIDGVMIKPQWLDFKLILKT